MCSSVLTKAAEQVLSKGFNYAIAPKKLPVENIVCGVENAISILEANATETIRQRVCTILRNTRPPKKNFNTEELNALIQVKRNENIIIPPADKGIATVVLNTRIYKDKIQKLLDDPTYKSITTDPTTYLEKKTRSKTNSAQLSEETRKSVISRGKSTKYPKVYGLPKIHKQDVHLRPIVSSTGSPTQALAQYLASQLKPYGEQMTSTSRSSSPIASRTRASRRR
ncbi:hypothetical protein Trydic_g7281 [Trypoxylus dichotomus]